ncbi:S-layer homology domain-containing protein [Paenibacillus hexagrammi]|uniref:S-layer homology domain-containing protein n=1 Tax=Paenibacillus hexagrammi TaxID=2908839 RepID=A0ABY3SE35_9BACL|nr:S-layer homology domain-containing protein [Paenibacillus sp. YPD9-1]UJF32254.1 S-layer homology domain-containing protein [Paenibacillus sp. YPD9-1]
MDNQTNNGKRKKAYLKLVNASLLAVSLTSSMTGTASAYAQTNPQNIQSVEQIPVYQGNSLSYFQNMIQSTTTTIQSQNNGEYNPSMDRSVSVKANKLLRGYLAANQQADVKDDGVNYAILKSTENGSVRLVDADTGEYEYTPNAGFTGDDYFTYMLVDGQSFGIVNIHVKKSESSSSTPNSNVAIEASTKDNKTANAASVEMGTSANGNQVATIQVLADGLKEAAGKAKSGEVITIKAASVNGADVQANIPGAAIHALADKKAVLAIQTGDVGVRIPSASSALQRAVAQAGTTMDQASVRIDIMKQPAPTVKAAAGKAVSDAYQLKLTLTVDGKESPVAGFDKQFASVSMSLPAAPQDAKNLVGVMVENGRLTPVPLTVDADGSVDLHSTRSGTFMVIEHTAPAFSDTKGHWASDAIQTLSDKMIIQDSGSLFNPDSNITRAEFAVMMSRALGLAGSEMSAQASPFHDINPDAADAAAIQATVEAGIFKGVAEDLFAPDRIITREQMAAVLIRAAKAYDLILPASASAPKLTQYQDFQNVSDWAKQEVGEAIQAGLIQGVSDTSISSSSSGTKAQSAMLLMQLLKRVGLMN